MSDEEIVKGSDGKESWVVDEENLRRPSRHKYSDFYKEELFHHWYQSGRPGIEGYGKSGNVPLDEHGHKPSAQVILDWSYEYRWVDRANDLDLEVTQELKIRTIEAKIEMFRRHAQIGKELIETGLNFLKEEGLDKSADALRAIIEGTRMERESTGIPDALLKLSSMSDGQLTKFVERLIAGTTLERPELPEEKKSNDVVDGEFEDVKDGTG